jgi:hypothetical protein
MILDIKGYTVDGKDYSTYLGYGISAIIMAKHDKNNQKYISCVKIFFFSVPD